MKFHDARRVRMFLETGELFCFNSDHGTTKLTPAECDLMYHKTGLTPNEMRTPRSPLRLFLGGLRSRISELFRPVRCVSQ